MGNTIVAATWLTCAAPPLPHPRPVPIPIRLTVRNSANKTGVENVQIVVGNTAPTVVVSSPLNGDFFEFGDVIQVTAAVSDPEDGPIDCTKVRMQINVLRLALATATANTAAMSTCAHLEEKGRFAAALGKLVLMVPPPSSGILFRVNMPIASSIKNQLRCPRHFSLVLFAHNRATDIPAAHTPCR